MLTMCYLNIHEWIRDGPPMVDRMLAFFTRIFATLSALILVALTLLVGWHVFTRYVLRDPLFWGEEVTRFLVLGLTFTGMVYALSDRTHLRVDVVDKILSPRAQRVLDIFVNSLVCVALLIVSIGALPYVERFLASPSPASGLPRGYVYIPILITFLVGALVALLHTVKAIKTPPCAKVTRGTSDSNIDPTD